LSAGTPAELQLPAVGVGTWAWGEKAYWGSGEAPATPEGSGDFGRFGPDEIVEAFGEATGAGLRFFDTAEVYGHGESEKILGFLAERYEEPLIVATKFALLPGRPGAKVLRRALEASLRRLRRGQIDLYQVHWADTQMASIESLMDAMADAVGDGLVRAVGVSNFSADETRKAHDALSRRGLRLFSNQVRYSLLHRAPEVDGVLEACREIGATVLAYSPLEQGILAGKYLEGPPPPGRRGQQPWFAPAKLAASAGVVARLREIGKVHGVGPAEIAIRWLMEIPGVVPIPGATRGEQARGIARAAALALTADERGALDEASRAAGQVGAGAL
jgi:aryl-alcohol dehydrogenase-like predicted oxidoreductase